MPKETQDVQPKTETSSGAPEKSPFAGDAMDKFAEQIGLFEDEPKAPAPAKQKALKETKPCEDCPDGDEAESQPKTAPKEAPKTPFKVLKDSAGKEVPVYSQEELDELALKGATGQKQSQAEAKAQQIEDRLRNAMLQLDRIEKYAQGGAPPEEAKGGEPEEEVDLDTIDDPAVRNLLKKQNEKIQRLSKVAETTVQTKRSDVIKEVGSALDEIFKSAREETPFEDIRFEKDGPNFSETLFSGLLQQKVSRDKLEKGELRGVDQYIKEAVADLNRIERYYRGKYSNSKGELTSEQIISTYPKIAEEIGQRAVADWQKKLDEAPPVAKSRSEDILHRRESGAESKGFKSLDEALSQAFANPEIAEALEEAKRKTHV